MRRYAFAAGVLFVLFGASVAAQENDPDERTDDEKPKILYWDEGLFMRTRKWNFQTKFGGLAQNDTAGFAVNGEVPVELNGGVEWRRARAYALGSFGRFWDFKFQWDFTTGTINLTDMWLGLHFDLWRQKMRVRAGRYSSTFGLENDGRSDDTLFMEQGLTSVFVPPQETGVLLHSESNRRRWDISFSSRADVQDCIICDVVGVAGRYSTSYTFGREDRRLHWGFNYSRRWPDEAVNYQQRPESHIAPFFVETGPILSDRVDSGLLELAYVSGPASFQSEYAFSRVHRPDADALLFQAVYVAAAYSLTGESRPYAESFGTLRRIRATRPMTEGGTGALELAVRYSHIDLRDQTVNGGSLTDLTFGLNWYPLYLARVTFNAVNAHRRGWDAVWIFQGRIQVGF